MKSIVQKYSIIISTGILFYILSEKFFWAFWRIGQDTFTHTLSGILFYTLGAWAVLFLVHYYKISRAEGIWLIAFIYAFAMETIIANTLFTSEFPLILFIAIPWHMYITIFFGWYYLPKKIESFSVLRKVILFGALGCIWAIWAFGWFSLPQGKQYAYDISNFIICSGILFLLLPLFYAILGRLYSKYSLIFHKREGALILCLFLAFAYMTYPQSFIFVAPTTLLLSLCITTILKKGQQNGEPFIVPSVSFIRFLPFSFIAFLTSVVTMVFMIKEIGLSQTTYLVSLPMALICYLMLIKSIFSYLLTRRENV